MKKAKLMLAAIAVVAIAGGVYASKASRSSHSLFVTNGVAGQCQLELEGITTLPNNQPSSIRYATEVAGPCVTKRVYITD